MEDNASKLCKLFQSNKPFLIGRNGTIELEVLSLFLDGIPFTQNLLNILEKNAGIFPSESINVSNWCRDYLKALSNTDILAEGWYTPLKEAEKNMLDTINPSRTSILLRNLEPYYVKPELRWTQYLANKRVAIINSFAQTCEEQTYLSKAVWPENTESLLPDSTHWIPIQTYYSPILALGSAEWPAHIRNYKEAVKYIVSQTLLEEAEIAIIGCGGLGMLIGHELKKHRLQSIVMGGATPLLFGIRGKRWENHPIISKFFNDAWVVAPNSCKPNGYKMIEGGCYW
jgi:hypothetical protein